SQPDERLERLPSIEALQNKSGFVFAPFHCSASHPVLLLPMDACETHPLPHHSLLETAATITNSDKTDRARYAEDFKRFHEPLASGRFAKLVLSRSREVQTANALPPESLFFRACQLYPNLFVALVSTPVSGTWLMATPEILAEQQNQEWHTMALAGTMKAGETADWSTKNKKEQHYVSAYIHQCLQQVGTNISETPVQTVQAANLLHLRNDFKFRMPQGQSVGTLLATLHPTPAVCGLPKNEAQRFILENEQNQREYYSGFAGTIGFRGESHLYVTLRCMKIEADSYRLYAGGGLLSDSLEQQEWNETEAKMQTMMRCLNGLSIENNDV
ncbi:MAG TPA: isochorismate synthase, partial [Prevotella sp.]